MKRFIGGLCGLLVVLALAGCDGTSVRVADGGGVAPENVEAPDPQPVEKMVVSGMVLDAMSSGPIEEQAVQAQAASEESRAIYVMGPGASKVRNGQGDTLYDEQEQAAGPVPIEDDGSFTFYLNASEDDFPLHFQILADIDDYLPGSFNLSISRPPSDIQILPVVIRLIRAELTADEREDSRDPNMGLGVDVFADTLIASSAGIVEEEQVFETEPVLLGGKSLGKARLAVPAGTTIADEHGTPLSGPLTILLSYHNPMTFRSLETIPGGLLIQKDVDGEPLSEPGVLFAAGFLAVDLYDAQGRRAAYLEPEAQLAFALPQTLVDPEDGEPIDIASSMPLWSYSSADGNWEALKDDDGAPRVASPTREGQGDWLLEITTGKLSSYALGWHYSDTCDATLRLTGDSSVNLDDLGGLELQLERVGGGWARSVLHKSGETVMVPDVPAGEKARVQAFYGGRDVRIGLQEFDDLCAADGIDLRLSIPNVLKKFTTLDVAVYDQCSNNQTKYTPVPSTPVWATGLDFPFITANVTNKDGKTRLYGLLIDKSYTIKALNRRTLEFQKQTITMVGPNQGEILPFYFDQECEPPPPPTGATGGTGGSGGTGDLN